MSKMLKRSIKTYLCGKNKLEIQLHKTRNLFQFPANIHSYMYIEDGVFKLSSLFI